MARYAISHHLPTHGGLDALGVRYTVFDVRTATYAQRPDRFLGAGRGYDYPYLLVLEGVWRAIPTPVGIQYERDDGIVVAGSEIGACHAWKEE